MKTIETDHPNTIDPREAAYVIYARIYKATSILAIVNTKANESDRAVAICKGLLKSYKVKVLTDKEVQELSESQKKEFIDTTDLVITFGFDSNYSDVHCFILDLKNSGAITIGIGDIRNKFIMSLDLCMVDRMPGFMRNVVQLCKEGSQNEQIQNMVFR